jgi:hypothetical protein
MRLFTSALLSSVLLSATLIPSVASAERLLRPRPAITTTREGRDLRIVVHDVTEYCSTDAETQITRTRDAIRILHERPQRASRCIETQELTFIVKDVEPGRYTITYERMPLVAPARPLKVASTIVTVR